jgi:SET domain-containing protein
MSSSTLPVESSSKKYVTFNTSVSFNSPSAHITVSDVTEPSESLVARLLDASSDNPTMFTIITENDESMMPHDVEWVSDSQVSQGSSITCNCTQSKPCSVWNVDESSRNVCDNAVENRECNNENCKLGPICKNRNIQTAVAIACEIFIEGDAGLGLRSLCDIAPNVFIGEYKGEILTRTQMDELSHTLSLAQRQVTYAAYICSGIRVSKNGRKTKNAGLVDVIIDSRRKGNIFRFINSSCKPNCRLVRYIVDNKTRLAIYSCKEISSGEPLSFNYNLAKHTDPVLQIVCSNSCCKKPITTNSIETT